MKFESEAARAVVLPESANFNKNSATKISYVSFVAMKICYNYSHELQGDFIVL